MSTSDQSRNRSEQFRRAVPVRRQLGFAVLFLVLGALLGLVVGVLTPASVEIAGSHTALWVEPGHRYDQFGVQGVVTLKRATPRQVIGEPLGVRAVLDLDASALVDAKGQFNPDILPAYVQAYSDPTQLVSDIRGALITHLVFWTALGAGLGLLGVGARYGYAAWRRRYDRAHWPSGAGRATVRAYRTPERKLVLRTAVVVVLVVVGVAIPSGVRQLSGHSAVQGEAIFDGTPLAGVEVDGLLRPALLAAENYIQKYFSDTDSFYDELEKKLEQRLDQMPVTLPEGDDVAQVGFVTDRHCNTGMDRVDVALFKKLGVHTLVSAGDDDFSGSFGFESACTSGLAEQTKAAGITDVFVGGNHDSRQTIDDEKQQGIVTLTGDVVDVDGLRFLGSPDPRSSRYGQGIQPSSEQAQQRVIAAQGRAVARTACDSEGPIVAVLHDPRAGDDALADGCGKVTLALDGHTHEQAGPKTVSSSDGSTGYQFTGGSSGGAPNEHSVERDFASRLTVGPLRHDAFVYVVSVDRGTGDLVGITEFDISPAQDITVSQLSPSS